MLVVCAAPFPIGAPLLGARRGAVLALVVVVVVGLGPKAARPRPHRLLPALLPVPLRGRSVADFHPLVVLLWLGMLLSAMLLACPFFGLPR